MALRWFVGKLAEYGLLPKSVLNLLSNAGTLGSTGNPLQEQSRQQPSSCINSSADCCDSSASKVLWESSGVKIVESVQEFDTLLRTNETLVIKFTATWCMPCKKISPVYKELAQIHNDARFIEVDVDDLSSVASQFKVTVMPTFCIVLVNCASTGESTVVQMSGSDEKMLRSFMESHLTKRKIE
jgi:thioredoxin 1